MSVLLLSVLLGLSRLDQGAAAGERPPRDQLMSWVKLKVLEGLGVEGPPEVQAPDDERRNLGRSVPRRRARRGDDGSPGREEIQVILFTSSELSCPDSVPGQSPDTPFTYLFQPSVHPHASQVASAQLWFFSGVGLPLNSSVPVWMLTPGQLVLASPGPTRRSRDGWSTYDLRPVAVETMGGGPFWLQLHCPDCQCESDPDKTPFLNLVVQTGAARRAARSVSLPWSPSAVDLLQRPSQETHGDCSRAQIEISFQELGWDSWIVHPKTLTFYYCHGNCSSPERTAARLGVTQCCAPVPGRMRSIRITTTSDGGYSFTYETLPNIMPEECACI